MNLFELTSAQKECLRDQVITVDQPGAVLRDFRVLLEFVGPEGFLTGGKHNLLPMKFLGELDLCLSRPLHLELKRPQLRSHPYLQGLYLLLRASGLSGVEGAGTKARLVLVPEMQVQWDRLNPTEQYFNLMEAWLRLGSEEMIGGRGSSWRGMLASCVEAHRSLPEQGRRFDTKKPQQVYVSGVGRDFYLLALMDLFGLLEVVQPTGLVTTWVPAGIKHVPFGDAVCTLLASAYVNSVLGRNSALRNEDEGQEEAVDEDEEEEQDDDEEEEKEAQELPCFGAWQPLFHPYFPEWRHNLEFPELVPREGEFLFRVSLGKVWRLIAMPADATLGDLVGLVLDSMEFDDDHLYEFTYRDRLGAKATAVHPADDDGPWADEIEIGTLPLEPGQTMQLRYDFGDDWRFTIKLERIDPPGPEPKPPRIVESHGEAPAQYEDWND